MAFEVLQLLNLYGENQNKLQKIFEYIIKEDKDTEIYSFYPSITTVHRKVVDGWNYIQITASQMLFYIIPKYFDMGRINIDLADPIAVLNFFYAEYERRINSEETSEEIPIQIEKLE